MKLKITVLASGFALAAALPVLAHHSFAAEFDPTRAVRIQGTLTKIEWTNPHSYFYVDAKDQQGNIVHWGCEAGSPGALSRRGFKRGDIKLGDVACRGRVPRQGWISFDGRTPGDAAGWADCVRRFSGRWRPG